MFVWEKVPENPTNVRNLENYISNFTGLMVTIHGHRSHGHIYIWSVAEHEFNAVDLFVVENQLELSFETLRMLHHDNMCA